MAMIPKCPKCGCPNLMIERRPDGDAKCESCKWHGPYKECFSDAKKFGLNPELDKTTLPPRIRGRVGQLDDGPDKGKWAFEISIATFWGIQIGDPMGTFGPWETEEIARTEMTRAVKLCCDTISSRMSGGMPPANEAMDMIAGGVLKSWDQIEKENSK